MDFKESPLLKGYLSRTVSYLSTFLKLKFLKLLVKLGILFGLIWFVSGNWLGDKVIGFLKSSSGGFFSAITYVTLFVKGLAVASLIIILAKVIIGRPISKFLYILVGLGLLALLFEYFILA
ncbi:MAG: hypothetical protein K2Q34_06880 [Alphaproteobacteria bacterium]|nr:hypothetical protein [Alphaproteobacteria bacterium]